ncbi:hypothetical protein CTI12_AA035990 [Artemisia annua]|uniref:Uncharacterized protein n=1 Tax=Artemisia annua TaxID=35608 RepID=A0A2U1QFS8_ARTAN|nr:hypothetical protein CTI12_AA035990 [Artemisia annua]
MACDFMCSTWHTSPYHKSIAKKNVDIIDRIASEMYINKKTELPLLFHGIVAYDKHLQQDEYVDGLARSRKRGLKHEREKGFFGSIFLKTLYHDA